MKSIYRLKKNYQYNYVYKHAKSVADRRFILLYCPSGQDMQTRFGFSVGKKFGHAVTRNRIRRQMKAATSVYAADVTCGYNVVIIPRETPTGQYSEIVDSIGKLLKRAGLLQ